MDDDDQLDVNPLHEMIDESDRAADDAEADYLGTAEGAAERQAEVDAAEAETLLAMVAFYEHLPAGPGPSDQQRERWAAASQANQEQDRQENATAQANDPDADKPAEVIVQVEKEYRRRHLDVSDEFWVRVDLRPVDPT